MEFDSDTTKVKSNGKKYYFKESKYIRNKIFYSENNKLLKKQIERSDNKIISLFKSSLKSETVFNNLLSSEKIFFNTHPGMLIWVILISIAIAFSFSFIPFLISEISRFNQKIESNKTLWNSIIFSILVISLSLLPLFMLAQDYFDYLIKPLDTTKMFSTGLEKNGLHWNSIAPYVGVVFWLVLIFVMFAAAEKVYNKTKNNEEPVQKEEYISNLTTIQRIEAKFENQFIALAIFLAFTIFSTDLFLAKLNEMIQLNPKEKVFPIEFSFINGLMQTFFMGMIYFYFSGGLKSIKSKFLTLVPGNLDLTGFTPVTKKKGFLDYLKLIATILAPVIGSGVQQIFELVLGK